MNIYTLLLSFLVLSFCAAEQPSQGLTTVDTLDQQVHALMEKHRVPGVSLLEFEGEEVRNIMTYGSIQAGGAENINSESMFSVGSISKMVNATLVLKLVQEGILDLDTDVNQYLKSWKIKENQFNKNRPITLRHILSHTAGFSVHGFDDFLPGEDLPSTVEILSGMAPAKNSEVKTIFEVGSKFKYSGGGITVSQLIIEEVTNLPYHQAAKKYLFEPLGLQRTSYENPLPNSFGNIAKAHDSRGKPTALPRGYEAMPEKAASGLWTTPKDLHQILFAIMNSEETTGGFLSRELVKDMISPEDQSQFGLGPKTEIRGDELIVFHNGANNSYRGHFKIFWNEKTGYIIFTNGANGLDLIKELNPILDKR